jgi:nitroimidazol reductase NimA-like FMN-containing flavoprotein (pyridoxamine 5'-phosphate oxidase superfamily)
MLSSMGELPAMRRQDKEIKDPALLREILGNALVCRVAMCDGDRPYVIPLSFVLDGDALFVHSAAHGRKLAILARNPRVCFEVDEDVAPVPHREACSVGMRFRSVVGMGRATFVEDDAEKVRVLQRFAAKYAPKADARLPAHEVEKTVVIRLSIEALTGKRSGK